MLSPNENHFSNCITVFQKIAKVVSVKKNVREEGIAGLKGLVGIELCHLLHIYAYAFTVKQHKIHSLDRRGHCRHKIVGNSSQDQLGSGLLWKTISADNKNKGGLNDSNINNWHYNTVFYNEGLSSFGPDQLIN